MRGVHVHAHVPVRRAPDHMPIGIVHIHITMFLSMIVQWTSRNLLNMPSAVLMSRVDVPRACGPVAVRCACGCVRAGARARARHGARRAVESWRRCEQGNLVRHV